MKRAILLSILLCGCAAVRKVGHSFKPYWPSGECFRSYMCEELKFCGPNAGPIRVGDAICYSEDVTRGAARWICPDPPLPVCKGGKH